MSQQYVGIDRPTETRRILLETSRSILQALQAYEDLKDIRKERYAVTLLFSNQVKETQSAVRKLRNTLPKQEVEKGVKKIRSETRELKSMEKIPLIQVVFPKITCGVISLDGKQCGDPRDLGSIGCSEFRRRSNENRSLLQS